MDLPGYKPNTKPHSRQIREAAKLIAAAHEPVLYVGGGVIRGEATEQLAGTGRADRHPGRHHADGARRLPGQPPAAPGHARDARHRGRGGALQRSDLLIALGTRFDDRVTGQLDSFAPEAKVIHADIDPPRSARTGTPTCRSSVTSKPSSPS